MTEIAWRKSSYSASQGACVEVGRRTSSYSATRGNCVEVAASPTEVLVRDTKDRPGGILSFAPTQWLALRRQLAD